MEVLVLASGSNGNATLVSSGGTSLLVDAGVSALQVRRRLEAFGRSPSKISGVLLTHEHSDHVRGLEVLLKRHPVPVWATAGTWSALAVRASRGGELVSGRVQRVGGLQVLPVATSHDAREPVALLIDDGTARVALCTDTGIFTALLAQRLAGCDVLLIETNHDADMLRHGPYPWSLKQRIASRLGHLGNHQASEAVEQVRSRALQAVVGLHLSEHNNLPDLARASVGAVVNGSPPVEVVPRGSMLGLTLEQGRVSFRPQAPPEPARRR